MQQPLKAKLCLASWLREAKAFQSLVGLSVVSWATDISSSASIGTGSGKILQRAVHTENWLRVMLPEALIALHVFVAQAPPMS